MVRLPTTSRRGALSPWTRLREIESDMDRWFRGALSPSLELAEDLGWAPTVDLVDADEEYTLTAELPGVKPEDVEVDVEDGSLTIRGEKKEEHREEKKDYRLFERSYGSFERSFALPRSVSVEDAKAEFTNGVLTVHLPKKEEARGRKIRIESKGA